MANYEPYRLTQTGEQVQQDLNDMEDLAPVTEESAGLMSVADKQKLDGLPSGTELENSLSGKVDKETGKGLSTNDYDDAEKAKVDSALQSETDPTVPAWAKQPNKPSYTAQEVGALPANTPIPTALSNLSEDTTHRVVTDAEKAAWNGKYTKSPDGIPASDLASGVIPDVSNFITKSVDDLVNYYLKSETYTKTEVQNLIAAINQFHYEIYASTSAVTSPASNVLYLIGPTGTGADKYEEYVYSNNAFVKIGDTSIDLSGYVTTTALNTALADYTTTANLTTLLAGKQDKIDSTHKLDYSLVDNTPTIPDAVEANPTVPSGTTPSDLTGLKIGSNYYGIPSSGGGDDEATEVSAAALCDINERMFEKKNLVDTYDRAVAGNHEKAATSFALYKLYFDYLENEEILATALCDLKIMGALASAIAPLYEKGTRTFVVGDCCIYDSQFYRCITAVPTPEPFDSTKWVKTSLFEEMVRRFNAL